MLLAGLLILLVTGVIVWLMPAPHPCLSFSCGADWNQGQVSLQPLNFLTWQQLAMLGLGIAAVVALVMLAFRKPI
jgi:hypothetical protein